MQDGELVGRQQDAVVLQTFFAADGVRYRVTAFPDWTVKRVKEALYRGGFAQSASDGGIASAGDIDLVYAGVVMDDEHSLSKYHVPHVRFIKYHLHYVTNHSTGLPVSHRGGWCAPPQPPATPGFSLLELTITAARSKHRWRCNNPPLHTQLLQVLLLPFRVLLM